MSADGGQSMNERVHGQRWTLNNFRIGLQLASEHENTRYVLLYEDSVGAELVKKGQQNREKEAL
jgi:hypothetical protein